jgi:hypothetical protein
MRVTSVAAVVALSSTLFTALPAGAAPHQVAGAGGSTSQSSPGTAEHVITAARTDTPPVIDGVIDEAEWAGASLATDFIQFQPQRGAPGTQRTEALLLHDDQTIYVAFRVWDDAPIAAQLTRRDADFFEDDGVIVLLDTFHDRQSAYYFGTNLLATQTDGRIANDGRTVDANWDGTWQAAASRTDFGWTAEFAIPLNTIKYRSGENVSWGINFGRSRRASLEVGYWAGPLDNRFRISQGGTVSQLEVAAAPKPYQVIPYGLTVIDQAGKANWKAGIDGRYEITTTTTTFGTFNPDFALIEADRERVNLTRFEVSLPEKRQFFIEGDAMFRQRIRTFYSRRIGDITAGGKLLGKEGPWAFSALYAHGEPGGQVSDEEAPVEGDFGVVRVQRDLGRSNIGFMGAGRQFEELGQGSVGMDANLFFTDTFGMTAQFAQSFGEHGGGSMAYFIRPSYDSATGHFHVRYTHLGDRFRDNVNAIGFIRDDNRREVDSATEKTWWPTGGALERIAYDSNYNVYWAADSDVLRSWKVDQGLEVETRSRWVFGIDYTEEFKLFEKEFRNREVEFEVGYNTREFNSVTFGYQFGTAFDSDFNLYTVGTAYKFTEQLSVEYSLEYLSLDPDPEDESTWIHVIRADQFFTPDLFINLFFQTNSSIDRRNIQATFVYRYQPPFGTLQFAFQRGTAEFGERSDQGNTFFVKATTVF